METKKLNNNNTMRTGVILAVIAVITLVALAMTFAKYAVQGTGEDSARVAKWGLNVNENLDLKLFSSSYKDPLDQSVTVDASDDASVVAPGTTQQAVVQLATYSGQAPEVMYHFEPTLSIENLGNTGQDLIEKLNENNGFTWTLKVNDGATTPYSTTDAICNAVTALGQKDIAPNTYPSSFGSTNAPTITIGWNWDFTAGGDQSDTELGNLIANNNLKSMKVTLNLNAYQCQGGCTTSCKPIVTKVGDTDVTFLPVYTGINPGYKFYTKDSTNGYKEIFSSGSMSDLATAIYNAGGATNVYTDAKNTTFYGTINKTWNNTFKSDTKSGVSKGLNSSFVSDLDLAGVKTVYFAENTDTDDTSIGNWNAQEGETEPLLGTVGYNAYYDAYNNIVKTFFDNPWSSRAVDNDYCYSWNYYDGFWIDYGDRTETTAVILTKTF